MRLSLTQIKDRKNAEKITAVTAYDYSSAKLLDGEVDILLVGDSLGMVVYGFDSTLPVTLEMMANHARAVVKGSSKSFVVVDMPFGSYQESPAQAFKNAAYLLSQTGAQAVKLEGGAEMFETVRFLNERGIAVMGHVGLQPQSVTAYGGFKIQGKSDSDAIRILHAAKKMEEAGCFAIVIEGVKKKLASKITAEISIPTIGIGASVDCDGQVLVYHDLLGITESTPKFVKSYASLGKTIVKAVKEYAREVKSKQFPTDDNCY